MMSGYGSPPLHVKGSNLKRSLALIVLLLLLTLAGPVCGENLAWWQVDYNGLVGWTAEGQGNEYWLESLS
jgi:hypothetical protein